MKNVPIIGKFLAIIAIFGVFAIGVAFYATNRIDAVNNGYSGLGSHEQSATLNVSRAARNLQTMRASIIELAIARDQASIEKATAALAASRESFEGYMDDAIKQSPQDASDLTALKARGAAAMDHDCAEAIRLGKLPPTPENVEAATTALLQTCSPSFEARTAEYSAEMDKLTNRIDTASRALTTMTRQTVLTTYAVILGGLLLVATMAFFAIRSWITLPLKGLNATMERLASGDLTAIIDGEDRKDEVGSMAKTVQVFKDAGIEKIRLESEATENRQAAEAERARNQAAADAAAREQAAVVSALGEGLDHLTRGDLTYRLNQQFPQDYVKLQEDFNAAIAQLKDAMSVVVTNVSAIRSGAGEISQAADDLSRRTEQQAASLEETAAALDQITATVNKTASGARQASDVVLAARGDAETSGNVVRDAVTAMSAIEQSAQQISQIIGVIDEIAFQTNLLALNAGVEAARAGDAGRGFAVVASEVRALAQRSAEAAKEIKTLISASTTQVDQGVSLVGQTGEALQRIVGRVAEIDSLVSEIAASAQEQATGLQQVNTAVNQMDQVTQQNAAMVEESTAASHSLAQEAETLAGSVSRFELGNAAPVAQAHAPARRPAARPVAALKKVGRGGAARKLAPVGSEDGWEEF